MNEFPPDQDEADDADDLYRRAAALDNSRPSELVRRRVLNHAAKLAAQRGAQNDSRIAAPGASGRPWRRPAIFGTLAAAALAGLLIAPHFLPSRAPEMAMEIREKQSLSSEAAAPAPAPTSAPTPAPAPLAPGAAEGMAKAPESQNNAALREYSVPRMAAKHVPAKDALAAARPAETPPAETPPAELALNEPAAAAADADSKMQDVTTARRATAAPRVQAAPLASAGAPLPLPLHRAAESGDISELERLLEHSDVDARDAGGRTPLMLAVAHGRADAVDVLLAHGADPNARDAGGTTPLQAAVAEDRQAIAAALRRAGAR